MTRLNISSNNFHEQDLSMFGHLINLESLWINNNNQERINQGVYNRFKGSLEPLKNLNKLRELNISNTDIDSGLEHLPKSADLDLTIYYSAQKRPRSKVKEIAEQLDFFANKKNWKEFGFNPEEIKQWITAGAIINDAKFVAWLRDIKKYTPEWIANNKENYQVLSKRFEYYGLCKECQQPNTGRQWCQPCNTSRLEKDFNKWTSKNPVVDEFIKNHQLKALAGSQMLEWIPYERLKDIRHLADGGFSRIYRARWLDMGHIESWDAQKNRWQRRLDYAENDCGEVILKSLNNSQSITTRFLKEIANHKLFDNYLIARCFGISQDPVTKDYLMVMEYMKEGNLRQFLQNKYCPDFGKKLFQLQKIAKGLNAIHEQGLVHRDFHSGNILISHDICYITDLGLCRPANETNREKIYGVLPYVAPEVLKGEQYTQASDIYSFGIMAYELFANSYPYRDYNNDSILAFRVCEGLRPNLDSVKAPQLLKNLISKCWNANPEQRPMAEELEKILLDWYMEVLYKKNTEFYQQYQEIKGTREFNNNPTYKTYPSVVYTSRLLPIKEITRLLHSSNNLQTKASELNTQLIKIQELAKEINAIEEQKSAWETKAEQKYNDLKKALKLAFEKSDELEKIVTDNQLIISEEMKELLKSKLIEVKELKARVNELEAKDKIAWQALKEKKSQLEKELNKMKSDCLKKAGNYGKEKLQEKLTKLLRFQVDITISNALSASDGKEEIIKKLVDKTLMVKDELNNLCQRQEEITQLAMQLENTVIRQGEKQLTQIVTNINVGDINNEKGYVLIGNQINNTDLSYSNTKEPTNQELTTSRTKRQLSISSITELSREENKIIKLDEELERKSQAEPMEIEENDQQTAQILQQNPYPNQGGKP
ncbi:MAG: hypothetical protein MRECE_13c028 [Mycoplasmataceae bacterium CE_OT135]|nr:MAG: hypothetical protein MRECE_13c028 [Mycoplasmataceae bacterium CE_OT135]